MPCYNHCKIDCLVENIIVTLSFQFHFVIPLSFNLVQNFLLGKGSSNIMLSFCFGNTFLS